MSTYSDLDGMSRSQGGSWQQRVNTDRTTSLEDIPAYPWVGDDAISELAYCVREAMSSCSEVTHPIKRVTLLENFGSDDVTPNTGWNEASRGFGQRVEIDMNGPWLEVSHPICRRADNLRNCKFHEV